MSTLYALGMFQFHGLDFPIASVSGRKPLVGVKNKTKTYRINNSI